LGNGVGGVGSGRRRVWGLKEEVASAAVSLLRLHRQAAPSGVSIGGGTERGGLDDGGVWDNCGGAERNSVVAGQRGSARGGDLLLLKYHQRGGGGDLILLLLLDHRG